MTTLSLSPEARQRRAAKRSPPAQTIPETPIARPEPTAQAAALSPRRTIGQILDGFSARWPAAFTEPPVPLAIGIRVAMLAERGYLSSADLKRGLSVWCRKPAYLKAVAAPGARRVHLDGSDAGEVSDANRAWAGEQLDKVTP
jgi:sRNA-binding protein